MESSSNRNRNNNRRSNHRRNVRRRRKRTRQYRGLPFEINGYVAAAILVIILVVIVGVTMINKKGLGSRATASYKTADTLGYEIKEWPELDVELLDINPYSRPGDKLEKVNGIVIHYTANPGSSAMANRDYFNNLANTHETSASSHFIVGLEGEIVQCIPCDEIAYASKERNVDTISIECCIEDDTGKFNKQTYNSLVELTAWLMGRYQVTIDDVIRHYDVTGKLCPKYYVENEDAWKQLKADVHDYLLKHGETNK